MDTEGVCERMVQQRLLVISADAGDEPQVLLAHHALISAWPRLLTWVDEVRAELSLRQQLWYAAKDWYQSGHRREGLLSEPSLLLLRDGTAELSIAVTPLEEEYVRASLVDVSRSRGMRYLANLLSGAALTLSLIGVYLLATDGTTIWASILPSVAAPSSALASLIAWRMRRGGRRSLTPPVEP
jgi:hypothetical protein